MGRLPFVAVAVVLGIILIGLSVVTAFRDQDRLADEEAQTVRAVAGGERQDLTNYFERSASLLRLLAENPVFAEIYELPEVRRGAAPDRGEVLGHAEESLALMDQLVPGGIGEAELIDDSGDEFARAIAGDISADEDLDEDEERRSFYEPSFALGPGGIYQSPPYVSPEAEEWSIANATPIELPERAGEAIVKFDVPIENFWLEAKSVSDEVDSIVVDRTSETIVFDTRHPDPSGTGPLQATDAHDLLGDVNLDGEGGTIDAGGRIAAYAPVDRGEGNANDWVVVAASRAPLPGLLSNVGPAQIALLVGGILLLGAALALQRTSRLAAEEADRAKGDLLGLVSHELRTPLTSIIGYTELLCDLEAERLSDQGKGFLDVIGRNANRELRLVGDLLVLQQIDSGKFSIHPAPMDLGPVLEGAVESVRARADEAGIELRVELAPAGAVSGDSERLGQVLDNLLSNAIKYSPEGGSIDVRLFTAGHSAVVEVADTGLGIPEDELDQLFERMYRAKAATALHIQGVGLGLSIVKAIVEAHGGRVSVSSRVGEGTTFRVELPVTSAPAPQAKTPLGAL